MRVRIGNGGWVGIDDLGLPGLLYLRLGGTDDTGRLRITDLYLDASTNRNTAAGCGWPRTGRRRH